jgi:hypothetical protein
VQLVQVLGVEVGVRVDEVQSHPHRIEMDKTKVEVVQFW